MKSTISFKENYDTNILLLTGLYITSLLANLAFGYRYINLGFLNQSGGIFIFPFSFIISDIVTEIYGSTLAKKMVIYGIGCQFIFAIYAFFLIHLPAPNFLKNAYMYHEIFSPYLTFAFASSMGIWIGSMVNIFLLSKLSEFSGCEYFAVRSFVASTFGEFLVTVISMMIANYSKMDFQTLVYMIGSCFFVKTLISVIAIWPAAIIVYQLENRNQNNTLFKGYLNPVIYIKKLLYAAWTAKSYIYNLELINLDTHMVHMYYKGTRGIVKLNIHKIVFNKELINKFKSIDAAHIGYYYGQTETKEQSKYKYYFNQYPSMKKGMLNIYASRMNFRNFF
jgi:queuosine precursor transporter